MILSCYICVGVEKTTTPNLTLKGSAMKTISIQPMRKLEAALVAGSVTQTTKMPCKSYSLPTVACITGFKMAKIPGSICSTCYANKGNYMMYANNIEPAQHARLDSLHDALWVDAMVAHIGADKYFRWHDSGDLQGLWHLEKIATVAQLTPDCMHWLPTREYSMVKAYIAKHGALPGNLIVRLSAMYVDKLVTIPASLQGQANVTVSNVHTITPMGLECQAPKNKGQCGPCRACWSTEPVSYKAH